MTDETIVPVNIESESDTTSSSSVDTGTTADTTQVSKPEVKKEKPSFRDAISSAFDELEAKKKTQPTEQPGGKRQVAQAPVKTDAAAPAETEQFDPLTGNKIEPVKAPTGMPAPLREKWKEVPAEFQKYWSQREKDMARNYTELGNAKKFSEQIREYVQPMDALLKQHNTTVESYSKAVFEASTVLNTGSPQQRAAVIANMIKTFQPDVPTLRAILDNKPVNIQQAPKPPVDIDAEVNKRLETRQSQEADAQVVAVMENFANEHEFAQDLETQMTSAITGGFVQTEGKSMPEILKAAYDFACKNHPEISGILAARGSIPNAQLSTQPNQQVVKPVRSAKPSPGPGIPSKQPAKKYKNAKEAAAAAYDEIVGGR